MERVHVAEVVQVHERARRELLRGPQRVRLSEQRTERVDRDTRHERVLRHGRAKKSREPRRIALRGKRGVVSASESGRGSDVNLSGGGVCELYARTERHEQPRERLHEPHTGRGRRGVHAERALGTQRRRPLALPLRREERVEQLRGGGRERRERRGRRRVRGRGEA